MTDRPRTRAVTRAYLLQPEPDPREYARALVAAHAADCHDEERDLYSADEGVSHAARWGGR